MLRWFWKLANITLESGYQQSAFFNHLQAEAGVLRGKAASVGE